MTARQQIARVLPLVLLVVLVIAGLRGVVPAPRWNGPLKADGEAERSPLKPSLMSCALAPTAARLKAAAQTSV